MKGTLTDPKYFDVYFFKHFFKHMFVPILTGISWLFCFLLLDATVDYLSNPVFSLTCRLVWNALSFHDVAFSADLAKMPDCHRYDHGLEEMAGHFFYCPLVRLF